MKSFLEWIKKKDYKNKEDYCKKCNAYLPGKLNKNGICYACEEQYKGYRGKWNLSK